MIKNFSSQTKSLIIDEGDLKAKFSPEISLEANFNSNLNYNAKIESYKNILDRLNFIKNLLILDSKLSNNFLINFDKTYKVKKFKYSGNGIISKSSLGFKRKF